MCLGVGAVSYILLIPVCPSTDFTITRGKAGCIIEWDSGKLSITILHTVNGENLRYSAKFNNFWSQYVGRLVYRLRGKILVYDISPRRSQGV